MAKKIQVRKYKLASYEKKALQFLLPPEDITVSEWAESYRILDAKTSATPGHWRNDRTPYLCEIMNELNNYEIEEIIFVKPTQVGGTETLQNMLGYSIQQDPSPTMIVYPTETLAKSVSENRIQQMLKTSPALKKQWKEFDSSVLELQFEGMYLILAGSNSPSGLASYPIRFLFLDEVDKYPGASRKESDPISLAKERTRTFYNKKIFMTSTPTLKNGHIWKAKEDSDVEKHYFVPCPHCGQKIELKWAQINFPGDENGLSYADRAEAAVYVCQECGCIINDKDKPKMLRCGEWQVVRQNTKHVRKVAYWMNTLYSPFVRFSEIAKEFLSSKDDPERLQNFTNSWLAEPWEDTKLKTTEDLVMERQTELPEMVIPEWAEIITGGVDVQETSLYYTIRAYGKFTTSQNIVHGQVLSFSEIEQIMNAEFVTEDGRKMIVNLTLIDSGYQPDATYDFCVSNSDWALPCKGSSNPMRDRYKISKVDRINSKAYGMQLVFVDGDQYKDSIASRMRKGNGTGSWMVYKDCDKEYAKQVTAEHKVLEKSSNGAKRMRWILKHSHADNHYLDCEVYSMAAAEILGVRSLHLQSNEIQEQQETEEKSSEENWIQAQDDWI